MMEDQLPNNKEIVTPTKALLPLPPQHLEVVSATSSDFVMSSSLSPVSQKPQHHADDSDEKCDVDPENSKKSCSDVTPDTTDDISFIDNQDASDEPSEKSDNNNCDKRGTIAASACVLNTDKENAGGATSADKSSESSKAAFAFTIDFNDGKQIDSKKKNDIFERFQKRHKRGVSLSKLDDQSTLNNTPFSKSKPPLKRTVSKPLTVEATEVEEVTVTLRDKSRLCPRDLPNGENRHSWSPRTSIHATEPVSNCGKAKGRQTATLKMAFQDQSAYDPSAVATLAQHDDDEDLVLGNAPPLEYRKQSFDSASSVSEAGTYTLDGDNYTEEQKALMSIDKLSKLSKGAAASTATNIDHSIEVIDLECLETVETFDQPKVKKHTSYLERIKSKVKTISERTFHKTRSPDKCIGIDVPMQPPKTLDLGNFTSVTSSGVFSKKPVQQLPSRTTARRKNSLTKSQIDNSEYIQKFDEKLLNSFTDYEKAQHNDYQLNIFSTQKLSDAERNHHRRHDDKAESQLSSCSTSTTTASYGIEMAETKNDWIQEWAKNARKNTRKPNSARASSERPSNRNTAGDYSNQMQGHCGVEEFGDNLDRNYSQRKNINRYDDTGNTSKGMEEPLFLRYEHRPQSATTFGRRRQIVDLISSSDFGDDDDMSLDSSSVLKHNTTSAYETSNRLRREFFARPPISPTKIPSPMHSMTRPRSSSVNRSLHSSITVRLLLLLISYFIFQILLKPK